MYVVGLILLIAWYLKYYPGSDRKLPSWPTCATSRGTSALSGLKFTDDHHGDHIDHPICRFDHFALGLQRSVDRLYGTNGDKSSTNSTIRFVIPTIVMINIMVIMTNSWWSIWSRPWWSSWSLSVPPVFFIWVMVVTMFSMINDQSGLSSWQLAWSWLPWWPWWSR